MRDFASILRRGGIKLSQIRSSTRIWCRRLAELCVPLAQGFVFAAPRAVRAEVLGQGAQPWWRTIFAASVDFKAARDYRPANSQ